MDHYGSKPHGPGVMRYRNVAVAFGRILRETRVQKKLSQEELAHRAGIDRTYPSMIELGRRQPTIGVIFAIAKVLNVSPVALVNRTLEELEK